jgi:multimeric flavodoxin WrbA
MKKIVLISASPKIGEQSVSKKFNEMILSSINADNNIIDIIDVRQSLAKNTTEENYNKLLDADAVVITFPLYFFCLPGILTRFLQDYYVFYKQSFNKKNGVQVYAVVNCGFPEPDINLEAVRVIESFSRHIAAEFRFGVLIGAGGMIFTAENAPFMKKTLVKLKSAFSNIAFDIEKPVAKKIENFYISVNFPRRLYLLMGGFGWVQEAKKNGLKKKELYRRPYKINK